MDFTYSQFLRQNAFNQDSSLTARELFIQKFSVTKGTIQFTTGEVMDINEFLDLVMQGDIYIHNPTEIKRFFEPGIIGNIFRSVIIRNENIQNASQRNTYGTYTDPIQLLISELPILREPVEDVQATFERDILRLASIFNVDADTTSSLPVLGVTFTIQCDSVLVEFLRNLLSINDFQGIEVTDMGRDVYAIEVQRSAYLHYGELPWHLLGTRAQTVTYTFGIYKYWENVDTHKDILNYYTEYLQRGSSVYPTFQLSLFEDVLIISAQVLQTLSKLSSKLNKFTTVFSEANGSPAVPLSDIERKLLGRYYE